VKIDKNKVVPEKVCPRYCQMFHISNTSSLTVLIININGPFRLIYDNI